MFERDYVELLGLPSGADKVRKDLLESPRGLNGLVFKASDADATQHLLRDDGLAMLEPQSFSRPVTIDGVEHQARFRTVRTAPELFEAGRVYYCQHFTPELVWHRPWMSHSNGVRGLKEMVIVTANAEVDVPRYAKAAQSAPNREGDDWWIALSGGFRLTLMSPTGYRARYGGLGVEADGRSSFFGALVFDAPDLARIGGFASSVADLRVATGHDLRRWRVSAAAASAEEQEQCRGGSRSRKHRCPAGHLTSPHSGSTKTPTVCQRMAMRNTALTSMAAAAR